MDMDNGVGIDYGKGVGWVEGGKGENNWDNCKKQIFIKHRMGF